MNTHLLSTVLGGEEDTDNSWNTGNKYGDYRIWRYVTENTIPGPVDRQVNGITTGIVFKGKMVATEAAAASTDEDTRHLAEVINYTASGLMKDSYKIRLFICSAAICM